jgi:hypothetical protein
MVSYIDSIEDARYKICEHWKSANGRFYKIENSKYSEWVNTHKSRSYSEKKLEHFCIVGTLSTIDVVASDEPLISDIE